MLSLFPPISDLTVKIFGPLDGLTGFFIVTLIRNTIDLITGLSLMLFSKSFAYRINLEELKDVNSDRSSLNKESEDKQ